MTKLAAPQPSLGQTLLGSRWPHPLDFSPPFRPSRSPGENPSTGPSPDPHCDGRGLPKPLSVSSWYPHLRQAGGLTWPDPGSVFWATERDLTAPLAGETRLWGTAASPAGSCGDTLPSGMYNQGSGVVAQLQGRGWGALSRAGGNTATPSSAAATEAKSLHPEKHDLPRSVSPRRSHVRLGWAQPLLVPGLEGPGQVGPARQKAWPPPPRDVPQSG